MHHPFPSKLTKGKKEVPQKRISSSAPDIEIPPHARCGKPKEIYLTTRAPAFVSASLRTSSSRAMLVSPGVVMASAPWAAP